MKHHLKLLLGLSLLTLIFIVTGCGGGGGDKESPRISTDYYGLEVGATLIYSQSGYDTDGNYSDTATYKILNVNSEIYKTGYKGSSDSDFTNGDYIEKNADGNYYCKGEWETSLGDTMYDPPYDIIISNPIAIGSTGAEWGEAIRQETITVPAGTFNAWVFRDYSTETIGSVTYVNDDYTYFVPYLGIVKVIILNTEGGVTIESWTTTLTSYSFGTSALSINSYNVKSQTTTSSTSSKISKQLFRHKH